MEYKLTKEEVDSANVAIEKILNNPVENIDLTDSIPPINDIFDSNKVFKGKLSILFIDMRKSTDSTDELKSKKNGENISFFYPVSNSGHQILWRI